MKALIDGDMILYRSCFSVEQEVRWSDDIFTVHSDFSDLKKSFVGLIDYIQEELNASEIIVSFSDRLTFRHQMYPLYKAQRQGKRSPLGINDLREWVCDSYDIAFWQNMEADDVLGIMGSMDQEGSIIVSADKDFETVPCQWFNFLKGELRTITPEHARKFHLMQTIMGDSTDNYFGIKGVGPKTAEKMLEKDGYTWDTVITAYEKAGLTYDDALMNARLAYILQHQDVDHETKTIKKLWTPPQV